MVRSLMMFVAVVLSTAPVAERAQAQAADAGATGPAPGRYVPPKLGAPEHRVSGATRGIRGQANRLDVLAPRDVGLTAREQPTLYWFNSRPIEGDALLTIVDDASNQTILQAAIPGPLPAGINAFPLLGTQVRIREGVAYRWSITVIVSIREPNRNPVASGMIKHAARPVPDAANDVEALAAAGLWYDAVDAASQAIRRAPADSNLHEKRSVLLEQVGLLEAAAFDRKASR